MPEMQKSSYSQKGRIQWWQEARFGMFVHWGLYTIDGLDCWKMHIMGIPVEEYTAKYEHRFNPKKFDAEALVRVAKNTGCKYIVMGARHHEGYCLWNTKTTKFSSICMTPKRDFIAEYVKAAREAGLRIGLYYSLLDWRYKAYWDGPRKNPDNWKKFVDYVHVQVKELMTQYGKIDILWYDGSWSSSYWGFKPTDEDITKAWRSKKLNVMVRKLQPNILINNRFSYPYSGGDFGTPEQTITPEHRPWELCETMGELWGAASQDLNRKTAREIITRLITCVSQNGNMLLNIGPKADGSVQAWQAKIMDQIGNWLKEHSEAIYGCEGVRQAPFNNGLAPWKTTRKGNIFYLHLIHYPGQSFSIANLHDYWLKSAEILTTGRQLEIIHKPTLDIIKGFPKKSPDNIVTVVKLKTRYKTRKEQKARRTIALDNPDSVIRLIGQSCAT